ncbi:hypothetical protein AM1_G0008 (plasmid) [Acaryochloris marina MBIC11017]|uniref:Uncharacterized protein n=1 Tax=Acaryochloris marina (strain MBIC 11017) TaxID=329726 RepID=A8ZQA2_ACAM1|nr:hypothetical protein AM1_G0008 [Acaryochloris marina MBIC11017]
MFKTRVTEHPSFLHNLKTTFQKPSYSSKGILVVISTPNNPSYLYYTKTYTKK